MGGGKKQESIIKGRPCTVPAWFFFNQGNKENGFHGRHYFMGKTGDDTAGCRPHVGFHGKCPL